MEKDEYNCRDVAEYVHKICSKLYPNYLLIVSEDDVGRWGVEVVDRGRPRWVVSYLHKGGIGRPDSGWFYRTINHDNEQDLYLLNMTSDEDISMQVDKAIKSIMEAKRYA